jgi:hypothetical protein
MRRADGMASPPLQRLLGALRTVAATGTPS